MKFYSKAQTLYNLKKKLKFSKIPKLLLFKTIDFKIKKIEIINQIKKNFKKKVAIRSSSHNEDSQKYSNAGKFKSILNVNPKNQAELNKSIEKVILLLKNNKDIFFVQEMAENIKLSGVVTTYSLTNNIKSYNINYHLGNNTANVTSGLGNNFNFFFLENKKYKLKNKNFIRIIKAAKELEKIFSTDKLDIEFALDKKNNFILLQVRRLILKNKILKKNLVNKKFNQLEKKIKKNQIFRPNLLGKTTFYSVMTDWNPAEMIGIKPKPLALSLYKNLITDEIWSKSRAECGYQFVKPYKLMTTFFGTPYIDIRTDFNSFLPNKLKKNIKKKLLNFYLTKFKKNTYLHDKIEFEIIFSSYTFNLKKRLLKELPRNQFSNNERKEIYNSLKDITLKIFSEKNLSDLGKINYLNNLNYAKKLDKIYEIDKIFLLINYCKNYGTLPFANLARSAFISIDLLNSLIELKIFSREDKENLIKSINLITTQFINDKNNKSKKFFLEKYGHLRPDMYEISNKNYKEGFKEYFSQNYHQKLKLFKFKLKKFQKKKINLILKKEKIYMNSDQLIEFITKSIFGREYAKFVFSKTIDLIFQNIKILMKRLNLDVRLASYLSIETILTCTNDLEISNLKKVYLGDIKKNQRKYISNNLIKLPSVIVSGEDLYIHTDTNKINFVSSKKVTSKLVNISKKNIKDLNGRIVLIENADPGYDYIFNQKIIGLITKYGGINSHMTIRCSELGIPAAIGIGENLYDKICLKKSITIDCQTKRIF